MYGSDMSHKHYGGGVLLFVVIVVLVILLLWWALRRDDKHKKHYKRSRSYSDECDQTSESRSARYSSDSKSRYSGSH